MKASRENSSTDKRRWVVRQKSYYGNVSFQIVDQEASTNGEPLMTVAKRAWADGIVRELTRDPKVVPGVRVRFADGADMLGASERDELHRVTEERYSAGETGVLAFPHPNQAANGCVGWWYVEVDSKIGPPRKLYVGVWSGGFELVEKESSK